MDQNNQDSFQSSGHCSQFHFSEKPIQFLLSLSVFSFLFSYSSFFPFLLHSFNHCISTLSTDRNCIFLLCNGILVFIIRNSGLIGNNSPLDADFTDNHVMIKTGDSKRQFSESKTVVSKVADDHEEIEEQGDGNGSDKDRVLTIIQKEEDEEQEDEFIVSAAEEEGGELWSVEELNKKCDDFIKKMRDGIKIEAQQLIMV